MPGTFLRYYEYEKQREAYEKENPVDPASAFIDRAKGPLGTGAILIGGYYTIPIVRGLADAYRDGEGANVLWPLISNARTGEKAREISKSQIPIFPKFLGLVLGCIEAKFCK